MSLCIECRSKVEHYYRSEMCLDCLKNFFEGDKNDEKEEVEEPVT